MTLSVGLRAPSAKEMMTRLTEYVDNTIVDGDFVRRYSDPELFQEPISSLTKLSEITPQVKIKAKALLTDAFLNLLDDNSFFDEFFGKLVTQSNRLRSNYPLPLSGLDEEDLESLGEFGNAKQCVRLALANEAILYAAEGISWAYSKADDQCHNCICRLYVDGKKWDIISINVNGNDYEKKIVDMIAMIATEKELTGEKLNKFAPIPKAIHALLEDLVQQGYLYGSAE